MTTRINPPSFNSAKSYERFKQEILAWREITELSKTKQGIAVALSLPEEDESQIKDKVFDQIPLDDLKSEDGLNILLAFLDKHLAKDDLADSLEKFEDFDDYRRKEGQTIHEYIATFDAKYRKVEKKNMTLPSEILAFKLLKKANISREEKLLVLTGMNFDNKHGLYEEAKALLKKFKGDEPGNSENMSIKLEPAYVAGNEETLLASGYVRKHYNRRGSRLGPNSQWRDSSAVQRNSSPNTQPRNKKMNPTGADGQTLTCDSCGSFRHLLQDCPDSWENMAKLNISDNENITL